MIQHIPPALTDDGNWARLLLLLAVAWLIYRAIPKRYRGPRWKWPTSEGRNPAPWKWPASEPQADVADPAQQLAFVSRVPFERQPLLNKAEFQVLLVLEDVVRRTRSGHRVMAQTSLGEILRPKLNAKRSADTDLAYRSINSKRADFVIVDRFGLAVLVVEYQGTGHYQGTARLRDAVKREAFQSAGITLIEVPATFDRAELARRVAGQLAPTPTTDITTAQKQTTASS